MPTANQLLEDIAHVGRDTDGGYHRMPWTPEVAQLREWFAGEAQVRGLEVAEDGNGNQLAWWGSGSDALLLGSHLDSVRGGGAYDGPLGIVSAFAAIDDLHAKGFAPRRPIVVANFTDEEGARFGLACLGSRLATGAITADKALALRDDDGTSLAEAMRRHGRAPEAAGPAEWLRDVGAFVELHVEQGRWLADGSAPVGVASAIWPHGRYRFDFTGQGNHAGTTAMGDRRDPMLGYAATVLAAASLAERTGQRATFGRVQVLPGSTNAIPSAVRAWLDARADSEPALDSLVAAILTEAEQAAARHGTGVVFTAESVTAAVAFDEVLRDRLATVLDAPVLPTGAGHDAGILSAHVPTAMLFVRNPTGISHAPEEFADEADCAAGVNALVRVVEELA